MRGRILRRRSAVGVLVAVIGLGLFSHASAATRAVDLDGQAANAAESAVSLNILSPFPAKVENRVTNRVTNGTYSFRWPSAGPGGFTSAFGPARVAGDGTVPGVGVVWVWQTAQTIYSLTGSACANDICFTRLAGTAEAPDNNPAWVVPGRTLAPNTVTVSYGSLTSSLISFFSPDHTLVEVTSSIHQLPNGEFSYATTYTNHTSDPVVLDFPAAPLGCCEQPYQLNCDGKCVDFLFDPDNCGSCGYTCNADNCYDCGKKEYFGGEESDAYCSWGTCCCSYGGYDFRGRAWTGGQASARDDSPARAVGDSRMSGKFEYAPPCETPPYTRTIYPFPAPPVTECTTQAYLPKEISGIFSVCGVGIPYGDANCTGPATSSQGTFQQWVPDLNNPVPDSGALLTVEAVSVTEMVGNGDGVLQPGETGKLCISVRNSGPVTYVAPAAVLVSPPVDLTADLNFDESMVSISQSMSPTPFSPDVHGLVPGPGGDCHGPFAPANLSTNCPTAYIVQVPPNHTPDVNRPFTLEFTGTVGGIPTPMHVPFNLGIGSAEADLKLTKQATPASVAAGANITYSLVVKNQGPLNAANLVVTDPIPAGTTFVSKSAPSGWTCDALTPGAGGTLTCRKSSLYSGSTATISFVVKATLCSGATSVSNKATVSSDTPDEHTDDNSMTVATPILNPTPVVDILSPATDQTALTNLSYPVTIRFRSQAPAPIARETISLDNCLLFDGATYGDRDGLLTDEYALQTTKPILCQAMSRCGLTVMYYPRIKVAATDTCGRTGRDDVIFRKSLLRSEVCPLPPFH